MNAQTIFPPTRAAALERLAHFVPKAGRTYAATRNYDRGPGEHSSVSMLSPYLRVRLVTETEVLKAVLGRHSPEAAEKLIQEVFWRTYWKGWLEQRPGVWRQYQSALRARLDDVQTQGGLRDRWEAACTGRTDIDCFNAWAQELVATGYLHNHARMWFASIWIFTLRLPWELGADFFLRHLIDGDPASNTLGWRWVGGLHTPGKTYLASADNIAKNTRGRFQPDGLVAEAPPLPMAPHPAARPAPKGDRLDLMAPTLLLVTEQDLCPDFLINQGLRPRAVAVLTDVAGRSPLGVADPVHRFTTDAITDALARLGATTALRFGRQDLAALIDLAGREGVTQIATPYAPTGPIALALDDLSRMAVPHGIRLARTLRDHDRMAWPHATHGFFRFREAVMG